MKPSARDLLIDDVQHGRKTQEEAEAEAERLGLQRFATEPDPAAFNPMDNKTVWSLPMTIAWIAWRSAQTCPRLVGRVSIRMLRLAFSKVAQWPRWAGL
jgi:hypothetical protein